MPTSTLQELRVHAVAVSAGLPPPMLHGVSVLQMSTLVIWSALAGPEVGTAGGTVVALGLALGLVLGEVLALGELFATGVDEDPPGARLKPHVPRRSRRSETVPP